jgi:hypothetical protein
LASKSHTKRWWCHCPAGLQAIIMQVQMGET